MKILLATDNSDDARLAADLLARLRMPAGTPVTLLAVYENLGRFIPENLLVREGESSALGDLHRREVQRLLADEADRLRDAHYQLDTVMREGHVAEQIVDLAGEIGANLVALGARGATGLPRFPLGAVAHCVLKHAPCSVLAARSPSRAADASKNEPLRILLAFDDSEPARAAVDLLAGLTPNDRVEITLLSVLTVATTFYRHDILERLSDAWQEYKRQSEQALEKAVAKLRAVTPHVTTRILDGGSDPSDEILQTADALSADLIVVGDKGQSAIKRFVLGSVSNLVVQHAPCSVLVVKR